MTENLENEKNDMTLVEAAEFLAPTLDVWEIGAQGEYVAPEYEDPDDPSTWGLGTETREDAISWNEYVTDNDHEAEHRNRVGRAEALRILINQATPDGRLMNAIFHDASKEEL